MFVWAIFLLSLFGFLTFVMGLIPSIHLNGFTDYQFVNVNGVGGVHQVPRRVVHVPTPGTDDDVSNRAGLAFAIGFAGVAGFASGGGFALFLWHAKGVRRLLVFTLPLIAGTGAA